MTLLRHQMIAALQLSGMGLWLHEALYLQPADIDGERRLVHVHRRTGAKDRYIPLPQDTLALLRTYWKTHQNSTGVYPATGRDQKSPVARD